MPTRENRLRAAAAFAGVLLLAAGLLSGCSTLDQQVRPEEDVSTPAEARAILDGIRKTNESLVSFKGMGRLTIRNEGKVQLDERMAWIGAEPLKLSVVLFGAGFPALRMAGNGEWLYYQDTSEPGAPVKRTQAEDPDFKRLLSIPIQASDILAILRGRIPIREHSSVRLQRTRSGDGYALLLMRTWGVHQKIFLDETKTQVIQTEVYDTFGSMLFQINFQEMQLIDRYKVPYRVAVSNDRKALVQLLVERYWPNVPVEPAMFVLAAPG
jgi:outer membrane biogenesis lipoprotein LolB